MIPMSLITGFLGAGKTTLVSHLAQQYADRRVVMLINEFAKRDVDAQRLAPMGNVIAIPGGSIFCNCLTAQFIEQMQQIASMRIDNEPPEGLIVEASGIANPMVVEKMLAETRLDEHFRLASIITVVDPGSFLKLLKTLPNITAQVHAADVALINKTDLHSSEQIDQVEAQLQAIRPGLEVRRTVQCRVDLDLFPSRSSRGLTGKYAQCADPNYDRFMMRIDPAITAEQLRDALRGLGERVYRAKGVIRLDGQPVDIDYASSNLQLHPVPANARVTDRLNLITSGDARYDVTKYLHALGRSPQLSTVE